MARTKVYIDIRTHANTRGIKQTREGLSGLASGLEAFGLAAQGAKAAWGIFSTALAAPVQILGELAGAFEVLDRESRKLAASMGALGGPEGQAAQAQLKNIELQSRLTGQATDELNRIQSQLNFRLQDAAVGGRALNTVLDTMQATGAADTQVLEALQGAAKGSFEVVGKLTGATKEEMDVLKKIRDPRERELKAIELLEEAYGGMRGEVDQGVAAYRTIENTLSDLIEETGRALFTNEAFATALQGTAIAVRQVVGIIGELFNALILAGTGQRDMSGSTVDLTTAVTTAIDVIGLFGEIIIRAVGAARTAFATLEAVVLTVVSGLGVVMAEFAGLVFTVWGGVFGAIGGGAAALVDALPSDLVPAWAKDVVKGLEEVESTFEELGAVADGFSKGFQDDIAGAWIAVGDAITDTDDAMRAWDSAVEGRKSAAIEEARAQQEQTEALAAQTGQYRDLAGAGAEYRAGAGKNVAATADLSAAFSGLGTVLAITRDGLARFTRQADEWLSTGERAAGSLRELIEGMTSGLAEDTEAGGAQSAFRGLFEIDTDPFVAAAQTASGAARKMRTDAAASFRAVSASFMQMGAQIGAGSVTVGAALLQGLGSSIQQLAPMFGEFIIQSAVGMGALQALAWPVAIVAGIALSALGSFISSAFTGTSGAKGAVGTAIAPIREAAASERGEDRGRTYVLVGPLVDENQAARYVRQHMQRAEARGL